VTVTTTNGADGADTEAQPELLAKIRTAKAKLDAADGTLVANMVEVGQLLAELRSKAKRNWTRQVQGLGFNERIARRYVALAGSSLVKTGLNESGLLAQVPSDWMKLEKVCKLSVEQLRKVLKRRDLHKATRAEVKAAVKKELGEQEDDDKEDNDDTDIKAKIDRFFKPLRPKVQKLIAAAANPNEKAQIRQLLAEEFHDLGQVVLLVDAEAEPATA
jgi:hypothetical protein